MSELSFKGMLESTEGRPLTDTQCAKVLLRSLEKLAATARDARESLAAVKWNFDQTLRDLKEFDDQASGRPLTPAQRAIYEPLVDELKEYSQLKVQGEKYLEHTTQRGLRILRLMEQLMASVTSAKP